MGFLEEILNATEELESPRSYWVWAGLAAISAAAKGLYLDRGSAYHLYPNIYVLLVGKSANRKGPPVNMAKKIVSMSEATRVISGRNTIQAVLKEVSLPKTFANGRVLSDSSCFLVSGEQSNMISEDPQAQTLLTELYDTGYNETWSNHTLSGGELKLKNPYFVMLGATAQAHDEQIIDQRSIQGGYVGRMMIVLEDKRSRLNSLTEKTKLKLNYVALAERLRQISRLRGEFQLSPSAVKVYNDWYYPYNEKLEKGEIVDDTGTSGRMGDHIFKVAMLQSLAQRDDLIITHEDIEDSLKLCTGFTVSVRRMSMGRGSTETGKKSVAVIMELLKQDDLTMSRSKIMQRLYGKLDKFDLDKALETLMLAGVIDEIRAYNVEPRYVLKKESADYFKQAVERGKM